MEMISQVFGAIQEATTDTETAKKPLLTEGKKAGQGQIRATFR